MKTISYVVKIYSNVENITIYFATIIVHHSINTIGQSAKLIGQYAYLIQFILTPSQAVHYCYYRDTFSHFFYGQIAKTFFVHIQ